MSLITDHYDRKLNKLTMKRIQRNLDRSKRVQTLLLCAVIGVMFMVSVQALTNDIDTHLDQAHITLK